MNANIITIPELAIVLFIFSTSAKISSSLENGTVRTNIGIIHRNRQVHEEQHIHKIADSFLSITYRNTRNLYSSPTTVARCRIVCIWGCLPLKIGQVPMLCFGRGRILTLIMGHVRGVLKVSRHMAIQFHHGNSGAPLDMVLISLHVYLLSQTPRTPPGTSPLLVPPVIRRYAPLFLHV